MPIYDYLCSNCGERTEVIHGISDAGPRFCPACGAEGTLRKAFAPPAVHFKGSGWAKKDRSSSKARTKSDAGAESGAATPPKGGSGDGSGDGSGAGPAASKSGGSSAGDTASSGSSSSSSDAAAG